MPRDRKKKDRQLKSLHKQAQFSKKYSNYTTPSKYKVNLSHEEPQAEEEAKVTQDNDATQEIETKQENEVVQKNESIQENKTPIITDTSKFFKGIENKIIGEKKEETVVNDTKVEEKPKTTFSAPPIPGMGNTPIKIGGANNVSALTEEERAKNQLELAKKGLEELNKLHGGLSEDKANREKTKKQFQDIIDSHKTAEDILKDLEKQTEKSRNERDRNEQLKKQLKEQEEQSIKNRFVEDSPKESEKENSEPEFDQIRIPDFYEKWPKHLTNDTLRSTVKAEMNAILKSAGIEDEKAFDVVEAAYDLVHHGLETLYIEGGARPKTRSAVVACFEDADLALRNSSVNLDFVDRLVIAQKITNVMFRNYSPVPFADHKLDYYTEDYVLKDDELLNHQLNSYKINPDELEQTKAEIIAGLNGQRVRKEEPPKEEPPKEEPPKEEPPKEEPPKEEPPKEEPPKEEPPKEEPPKEEPPKEEHRQNTENIKETKPVNSEARVAVYTEKLKAYNNMYKLNVDGDKFAESVTDAWTLLTSSDKQDIAKGQKALGDLFKDTLKKAFDVEKGVSYDEHRLPEYTEIIKSTNELVRSAMYGLTDMYHNAKRAELFESTAFGGLNAKDMVDLTTGQSLWGMNQKSDEAWDIQSKEAKNIAEQWMKGDRPHEKMIAEMKLLVEANKENIVSRKEIVDKLAAAEWLLENDEKMMVYDSSDPYNPVPNWGNRYWKTLIDTREALGIDKHTSMRDMIQADYAASAKAVNNRTYNEAQINYYVLDKDVREIADSRDVQMEQFAIQGAAVNLTKPKESNVSTDEMTENRVHHPVTELDERNLMKQEPKNNNWITVPSHNEELTIESHSHERTH